MLSVFKKQRSQSKFAQQPWLDVKIKALFAEGILALAAAKESAPPELHEFLNRAENFDTTELTEVALATLLRQEGLSYELATVDELFQAGDAFEAKLQRCEVVFLSTTFLRDLSELLPITARLKRPHNRLVVGGALMGILKDDWEGDADISLVAVGYGEFLIPSIAQWIKSNFTQLEAPPRGRMRQGQSIFLYSGTPVDRSLDFITKPDWRQAEKDHHKTFAMISYESVRGCPYRCSFCNYPFLFDDTAFRLKSAKKMAQDWLEYSQETGAKYITCLDSLFTLPKSRLLEFCAALIEQKNTLKWICYARADDLADEEVVKMMVAAGAVQVQIGLESGDQQILDNMNKKTTVAMNALAMQNCRKHGLTTVATLIVGFPGETAATLRSTYEHLKSAPPDFFFLATFSTRATNVPILSSESRERFSLMTSDNAYTSAPYWRHETMDCGEAVNHARWLRRKLVQDKISIDALSFYKNALGYRSEYRVPLLDLQAKLYEQASLKRHLFSAVHRAVDVFLRRDMKRGLGTQKQEIQKKNFSQSEALH